jgi:hypothetical protein
MHITAHDIDVFELLLVLVQPQLLALRDDPRHIVPRLVLKTLPDRHNLLLVLVRRGASGGLRYIENGCAMLVHVFYALVVLKVPNLHITLRDRYQNVLVRNRINLCHAVYKI